MNFLRITRVYPEYAASFYQARPGLELKCYEEQKASYDADFFSFPDSWTNALKKIGHEATDLTANLEPMQRMWWSENFSREAQPNDPDEIVVAQAKAFRPDVIWFDDHSAELLAKIRQEVKSVKLVIGWVGSAIPRNNAFKKMDVVLSCAPESVDILRAAGLKAEHLNHGFDERILYHLGDGRPKKYGLSFIGQIIRDSQFHEERTKLLESLTEISDFHVFSSIADLPWTHDLKVAAKKGAYHIGRMGAAAGLGEAMQRLPVIRSQMGRKSAPLSQRNRVLAPYLHSPVYGLAMFQTLRDSSVVLNIHADSSPRFASNMRLYETTGVGTCLLTDWKDNLPHLFTPNQEVVTFRSADECLEKAKWLNENPDEARKIGEAGQKRALREHTITHRAAELDAHLKKWM